MKNNKTSLLLSIVAVMAVIVMIMSGVQIINTRAALSPATAVYRGEIELDHLDVTLMENHKAVDGTLLVDLKDIDPGKEYREEISVRNGSDVEEYVRLVIRKYWSDASEKRVTLDPELIVLSYNGKDYNDTAWVENKAEATTERKVYYLRKILPGETESADLFDTIMIDDKIMDKYEVTTFKEGNSTITRLVFQYDGYYINLEAEVQSIQQAEADSAAASVWGNTGVSIDAATQTVKVGE